MSCSTLLRDPKEKVNRYDDPQYVTARDRLAGELAAWRKRQLNTLKQDATN